MRELWQCCRVFFVLTLLTGIIYPLVITGVAQVVFPFQANGSLLRTAGGEVTGSELLGQQFSNPRYFWGRPSATAPFASNAGASSGSNLGPTNPELARLLSERISKVKAGTGSGAPVPAELVTASASGLDPHVSPAGADYQVARVAGARGMSATEVRKLVERHTQGRQFGLLGEPRVNVLMLNLELDRAGY